MAVVIMALGLTLCIEGLTLALARSRLEEVLALLARLPLEARRLVGLLAVIVGLALIAAARAVEA